MLRTPELFLLQKKYKNTTQDTSEGHLEHHANHEGGQQGDGDKSKPPIDDDRPPTAGHQDRDPAKKHPDLA